MAIRVALKHETKYEYERAVSMGPQVIRLRPAPHNRTPIHRYSLRVEPRGHFLNWQQDPHGNFLARVVVPEKTKSFSVVVDLVADLEAYSPFDFFLDESAQEFPFAYSAEDQRELRAYLEIQEGQPELDRYLERVDRTRRSTVDFLVDLNRLVQQDVEYLIRMEPGVQTPDETLNRGKGSCRDSAWLLVQALRRLGLAARFVSGYLIQLQPDQVPVEGPPGPAADFTDLHAWCECYVPGGGWIGLDPTSGLFAAEGHIPLAATPFPSTAAPITGATEKANAELAFHMKVERIIDRPRITKPYAEEAWHRVLRLGDSVDEALARQDVRLTTGGEPTFVSARFPDAPEWNSAALGGEKAVLADRLMRRLFPLWAAGGVLHYGQGKWYPGEQLPRWAYSCIFRKDGMPLWHDPELLGRSGSNPGHTEEDAQRLAVRVAELVGVGTEGLRAAYEDAWYYLWKERKLPTNVDVLDARLEDEAERKRIARVFEQGLRKVVGYALPLAFDESGWVTGPWFLRQEHLLLLPGDSPMGFRLPLDSLPWAISHEQDAASGRDPFDAVHPLPPAGRGREARQAAPPQLRMRYARKADGQWERAEGATSAEPHIAPAQGESALGIVRTAMCFEPREGLLRVFLPPLATASAFVLLLSALERAVAELGLTAQLEGYPPPLDGALDRFQLTPDPGVIEVNVPPTSSFRGSVLQTEQLYEAARAEHLVAEKFEVDGTHVGSGGGSHLVLGGARPSDSPFLRRPDVLGSLLRFWHNHPALSYLFAGRFIGPTSQAPRFDEARDDSTYELEIALEQLRRAGEAPPPWFIDRTLRHLLVDVSGNTHRAEFCIDKLYSPDSSAGRLGLLEMRAFEMPPHERMHVVQQLLVRSLLSVFWSHPYEQPLVKWGTRLHDRFMLPFYVWADMEDVIQQLRRWGVPMEADWFEPHYEFRFPRYGQLDLDPLGVELRGALEPWHVLGEEAAGGGQARYVDSSVERMQVEVRGWVDERYVLTCNQQVVPLTKTGRQGQLVAGIRFRAWQPPSCLHPNIGVHDPLRFDIYDQWAGRSVAGCTYWVSHPGGRASEDRPVNAVAAESRRLARFERRGHSPGPYEPQRTAIHPHFPLTLDLRRT